MLGHWHTQETLYQPETKSTFWYDTEQHDLDEEPEVDQDVEEDIWYDTKECVDTSEDQLTVSHMAQQIEWTPAKVRQAHVTTIGLLEKLGLKRNPAGHSTAGYIAQELKPSAVPIIIDAGCSISVTPFLKTS